MDNVSHASRLVAWVRSVGVLATSAEQQAAWLDSLGPVASWNVGELGMEFDDGYLLMDQWVEAGWVSRKSVPSINALNQTLDDMSGEGNEALWTREALKQHEAWRTVRALAMAVLTTLT